MTSFMTASNFTAVYWNCPAFCIWVVLNKKLKLQVFLVVFLAPTVLYSSIEAQLYTMLDDEFSPSLMYWKSSVVRIRLFFCFKLQLIISTDFILMLYYIYVMFCFVFFFYRTYSDLQISADQEYAISEFCFVIYISAFFCVVSLIERQ